MRHTGSGALLWCPRAPGAQQKQHQSSTLSFNTPGATFPWDGVQEGFQLLALHLGKQGSRMYQIPSRGQHTPAPALQVFLERHTTQLGGGKRKEEEDTGMKHKCAALVI